ncbi:MAG: hypothetical protein JWN46_1792 [Acidimicrobiales bacterium]|nr:hypothetical protein [Acidimicrobiales bacterium]
MWPTWQQAAIAATLLLLVAAATRGRSFRGALITSALAAETALIAVLYVIWQIGDALPLAHNQGASQRGEQLYRWEQAWHLPSELTMQRWVLPHRYLAETCNVLYATVHGPALMVFLLWVFVRHRERYGHWRNTLAILTAFCLFIRFVRVAPPRLLPHLGFVDLSAVYGQSVYGPVGTGISDQFAAMPSIHVAWAALVGVGIVSVSTSRWRWLWLLHPVLTMWVVMVTGNHWWLDGLVAAALLGLSMLIDDGARKVVARAKGRPRGPRRPAIDLKVEVDPVEADARV